MTPEEKLYTLMAHAEDLQQHAQTLQTYAKTTLEKLDRQIAIFQDMVVNLGNQNGSSSD